MCVAESSAGQAQALYCRSFWAFASFHSHGFLARLDFFPAVDSGQIRLHLRLPAASRIEETERTADQVESLIRHVIPAAEIETILDN